MQTQSLVPATRPKAPAWDHGYKVGPKMVLKAKDAWAIRFELSHRGDLRDRARFDLAIDSKLRGCDVVKLRIGDIVSGGQDHRAIVDSWTEPRLTILLG